MTTLQLFDVVNITLGPLLHYPITSNRDFEFWTLKMHFFNSKGEEHTILAFANQPTHLDLTTVGTTEIPPLLRSVTDHSTPLAQAA